MTDDQHKAVVELIKARRAARLAGPKTQKYGMTLPAWLVLANTRKPRFAFRKVVVIAGPTRCHTMCGNEKT